MDSSITVTVETAATEGRARIVHRGAFALPSMIWRPRWLSTRVHQAAFHSVQRGWLDVVPDTLAVQNGQHMQSCERLEA
jgi:hypothetical protein